MAAGDTVLLAPVPACTNDAQLLGRLSRLRVALRNADHALIAKDRQIGYLLQRLAAVDPIQRGSLSDVPACNELDELDKAGRQEQPDSTHCEDAALHLEFLAFRAALHDERQVHAEECERLASEAALARARASSAARSDAAAAAAGAAEQGARDALAVSQRDAAVLYDQWRLRTEAAEQRASALQEQSDQARAAEHKAVAQQRVKAAAADAALEQLQDARRLAAWQERRITALEACDAHQTVHRLSAQLEGVQRRAAADQAALHAELATLRLQAAEQGGTSCDIALAEGSHKALCSDGQLGVSGLTHQSMGCEDDTRDVVGNDSTEADCEPIAAILDALVRQSSADSSQPLAKALISA